MNIKHVYSIKESVEEVAIDIKEQLNNFDIKMLIYFASSIFQQERLSQIMQDTFNSSTVFGCSTAGEIVSGKVLKGSVVAMAFNSNAIEDVRVEIVKNIKEDNSVRKALESFEEYYQQPGYSMKQSEFIGIVLMDGLSMSEEKVMEKIGDWSNVIFIGGSAGDDLKFSKTYVCGNGKAYTDAAVFALLKPIVPFDIIKTQSFRMMDKKLIATKVDEAAREVIEFNNKPATQAYAEALGVPIDELSNYFFSNPVGLITDEDMLGMVALEDIYVRSPQQIRGDRIIFYCSIPEGMEVTLLKNADIINDTKQAVEILKTELKSISAIIVFHCILRTIELEQKGQIQQYGEIFSDIPTIGLSTYGEAYIGHINQTSTMLAFK